MVKSNTKKQAILSLLNKNLETYFCDIPRCERPDVEIEDDDDNNSTVVPFQVAYAVSIHKAQGLEYDSVKIVITNETEERITHNIFYTAITRAKNKLKIYWSPETEQSVLDRLEVKNSNKDAYLLAQLSSLAMS